MTIDVGTGDGRVPYAQAVVDPERLFIGLDANASGMRTFSSRASRAGLDNLLYVRAAIERLPDDLNGVAGRVTIVLPWGSLLAAVARPSIGLLQGVRTLCRPQAALTVVLAVDPQRDRAELVRLGLPPIDRASLATRLAAAYPPAGFTLVSVRAITGSDLARWPSTWAKRLAHGSARAIFHIAARASDWSAKG